MTDHGQAPDVLRLHSDSLLSKWGFNDGDMPDRVYDYCDANGIGYAELNWTATLIRLVREHLLPALEHQVDVYEIVTIHNPIRARTVDGVRIDPTDLDDEVELTPQCVDVPLAVVMQQAVWGRDDA